MSEMEQERAPRRANRQKGRLILSGLSVIDCMIEDVSATGAKISLHHPMFLPDDFRLRFAATGDEAPVIKVWQKGLTSGVRFTAPPDRPQTKKAKRASLPNW